MNKPIRVLHVLHCLDRGGLETWLLRVLRNIDRTQIQMDFLVHTSKPGAYDEEVRALGSEIIPCPVDRNPWVYVNRLRTILCEKGPYDVIHSHLNLFSGLIMRISANQGVKHRIAHIYHPDNNASEKFTVRLKKRIMARWISNYSTVVLADSRFILDKFIFDYGINKIPSYVMYCDIELNRFNGEIDRDSIRRSLALPIGKPIITYIARFEPHKNHCQMIRIADMMNRYTDKYHFVMAGSHGTMLENIRQMVHDREDISLLFSQEDISDLLLASDLFLFPSLREGFGIVAVEASAAGLPIVATDLPTIREACPPSHRQFMFPAENDDIASINIKSILENHNLMSILSSDAKEWSNNFSIFRSVDNLTYLYNFGRINQ